MAGKSGRKGKPTINDVARLSGVSKKTVSRVINRSPLLNQATREKVEAVIAELGYFQGGRLRCTSWGEVEQPIDHLDTFEVLQRDLEEQLGKEAHVQVHRTHEESPIKLNNSFVVAPFEALLRLYTLPDYHEIDPSTFLFMSFPCDRRGL